MLRCKISRVKNVMLSNQQVHIIVSIILRYFLYLSFLSIPNPNDFFQLHQLKIIQRQIIIHKIQQNLQQLMYSGIIQESPTRYMLLDQNSEEIIDERIIPDIVSESLEGQTTKKLRKKISNTISLGVRLCNFSSIHNIEYSSKYGVLLIASDNEVVVKTTDELQEDLITQKQNAKGSMSISFSGELFLSPNEEILAICSESLMQFVKVSNLGNSNNIDVPPIPNLNSANHYLWVDNTHFLCWKFQGTATLYTIDPKTLKPIGEEEELDMDQVTGASVIHQHLFLISKMIIKIYQPFTGKAKVKSEIDMTDPHHDSPYFQYSYIIDIFKINIKEQKFTDKDVFGFVVVFYDVDQDASDERFLTFARGDIFNRQSLEIRGYENFYSTRTSKELFYNDDQEKLSFSVKRIVSNGFICIMLEKSEKLYVVDPLEEFERLNVYDIKSKHELKDDGGKFLQGMALMRNMLKIQRSMPQKGDEFLSEIVKKYNGEFMSLYFKDKETIAFPTSILAVGGDKLYRYAISSVDGIEDENNQQIFERLAKMKRSPHILQAAECNKIGDKTGKKEETVIKITQAQKKQEKKEVDERQQAPKEEPKKEERKEEPAKIGGDLFKGSSIFGSTPGSLFGKPAATDSAPKTGASLFGNPTADGPKPLFPGVPNMFGKTQNATITAPFAPSTGGNIFTFANHNPQPFIGAGILFGKTANSNSTSLFGATPTLLANQTTSQAGSTLFSNFGSSTFGNTSGTAPKILDLNKVNPSNDKNDETEVNIFTAKIEEKPIAPAIGKSTVEEKPKASSFLPTAEQEQKVLGIQSQDQNTSFASLFSTPAVSIFGNSEVQANKIVRIQQIQRISNIQDAYKPYQRSLNSQINNNKLLDQQKKRNINLKYNKKQMADFIDWQKATFNLRSYDTFQTQYFEIKQKIDIYYKFLRSFNWNDNEDAKLMTEFPRKTQHIIISHDESISQEIQRRMRKYQEISDKILYYAYLIGKKKKNMRALKPQTQTINKGTNILNQLIHQNEEKIEYLKHVSKEIRKRIEVLNEKRKKINDIGKQYNLVIDLAQELTEQKNINKPPKQEADYTIVQHGCIDKIPIIQLPIFAKKHDKNRLKQPKPQPFPYIQQRSQHSLVQQGKTVNSKTSQKPISQLFLNKQALNILFPYHRQSQITNNVIPQNNPYKSTLIINSFEPLNNYHINTSGNIFEENNIFSNRITVNSVTPPAHIFQKKQ